MTPEVEAIAENTAELYEEAPCGYLSTLASGEIIRVNRTFLSLTGYRAEECVGKRFSVLLTFPSSLLYETHCIPLLRLRGSISEISLDLVHRSGTPIPVLLNAVAKLGPDGSPSLFRMVVLNAPTRRNYERELLQARTQAEEATDRVRILHTAAERRVSEQQLLLQSVGRMAAGDLEAPIDIERSESLAPLPAALERMRKDILDQLHKLQARNAEILHLNEELRHQIEQRSRLLADSVLFEDDVEAGQALPVFPGGTLLAERYRIITLLGQGAMGDVYEVERMSDGRHFAAKILRIKPNSHTMVRFAREAQMLARLRHPNLIAIVDVDITEDRVAYIVMELARGTSLAELGRYYGDCAYMVPILSQIADALSAVHADGIVHRDLKPANVLISSTTEGSAPAAKLVDFGVSRLLDPQLDTPTPESPDRSQAELAALAIQSVEIAMTIDGPLRESNLSAPVSAHDLTTHPETLPSAIVSPAIVSPAIVWPTPSSQSASTPGRSRRRSRTPDKLTQVGTFLGTPLYMAPELRGGGSHALPPTDIFSFGVMAYEVLTGSLPFEELPLLMTERRAGELPFVPLHSLCPGLSPKLVQTLERCLSVNPATRPTASELALILREGSEHHNQTASA
jgi:PAS domain S-box-containing protein